MSIYYDTDRVTAHHGDCLDVLRADELGYDHRLGYFPPAIPDGSVDSVVTDPPYGLGFMGKDWDRPGSAARGGKTDDDLAANPCSRARAEYGGTSCGGDQAAQMRVFQHWCEEWVRECLRVLKPGGHIVAFGGSRTWHRLACAVEDSGFEIRDSIAWLYGSGFPKSMDVSKAINKAAGVEGSWRREDHPNRAGARRAPGNIIGQTDHTREDNPDGLRHVYEPTEHGQPWQGWGTALKPAFEPIVFARKPLAGTVAATVLTHGTGALNVDACRVPNRDRTDYGLATATRSHGSTYGAPSPSADFDSSKGRWPTNVVLDDAQADALDAQTGESQSRVGKPRGAAAGEGWGMTATGAEYDDVGGASRFFVKAGWSADDLEMADRFYYTAKAGSEERVRVAGVAHPTVKPLELMRWLARLITPPGGTVLDLFGGSGTTVEACILERFRCIAIERETTYLPLIRQRIDRRLNPVDAVRSSGEDTGLFELLIDNGGNP